MVTYASGNKPISVPCPIMVYHEIAKLANKEGLPLGQSALRLIERALRTAATPAADPYAHADGSREGRPVAAEEPAAPAPLPLEAVSLDALLAELRRRVDSSVNDEALGDAIARAEAAERKLDALREALA